ncbi:MAG: hypothetical protein ABI165_04930, partial [Bryobacteraceae bacterium]
MTNPRITDGGAKEFVALRRIASGVCVIAGLISAAGACSGAQSASELARQAHEAENSGRLVQAYVLYTEAATLDPSNRAYAERSRRLRPLAAAHDATNALASVNAPDPAADAITGAISPVEMEETRRLLPPPHLDLPAGSHSFDLRGDSKLVFEQIAASCGLTVLWELDYQPTPGFHFSLAGADCRTALRAAMDAGNSFVVPISPHAIEVARDTVQKRAELEPVVARAFPIAERASIPEVQEITVAIQQSLEIRRIVVDPQKRLIYMRDRASKVKTAEALLSEMIGYRPQVSIEVDYVSVDKDTSLKWGATLQNSFPLANFSNIANLAPALPAGIAKFLTFGGGASLIGIGITDAAAFATATRSKSSTSLESTVVTLDGQAASLHVGEKYPILSNGYFGTTTGTGQVYTPPPSFTFEDLGLVLKVTPAVHGMEDVTLDLDAEFKVLGTSTVDGIPVVNDRKFTGKVRLANGEWAVVAGLVNKTNSRTYSGFPWLDRISLLRSLFG